MERIGQDSRVDLVLGLTEQVQMLHCLGSMPHNVVLGPADLPILVVVDAAGL